MRVKSHPLYIDTKQGSSSPTSTGKALSNDSQPALKMEIHESLKHPKTWRSKTTQSVRVKRLHWQAIG